MIREQKQETFIERIKDEFPKLDFLSIVIEKEKVSIRFVLIEDLLDLNLIMEPSNWTGKDSYSAWLIYSTKAAYLTSERNLDVFVNNIKQLLLSKFQKVIYCL